MTDESLERLGGLVVEIDRQPDRALWQRALRVLEVAIWRDTCHEIHLPHRVGVRRRAPITSSGPPVSLGLSAIAVVVIAMVVRCSLRGSSCQRSYSPTLQGLLLTYRNDYLAFRVTRYQGISYRHLQSPTSLTREPCIRCTQEIYHW